MPSIASMFKNIVSVIEGLTDNHKNPLHVGEVMACWTYHAFVSNIISLEEVGLNTVTDSELKAFLRDAYKVTTSHQKELAEFLQKEGVPLSNAPQGKPRSNPDAIPLGAKLTEDEIANTINLNFVVAADMCAASASECLRMDVALMFLKYQTDKVSLGLQAREIMQKKGWLKIPPIYQPPGSTTQSKG